MINPELTGLMVQETQSPEFDYSGTGITLTHTYDCSNVVGPEYLIGTLGWAIGEPHWLAGGDTIYTRVRCTGFSIRRASNEEGYQTVTLSFAYPYSAAMNRYGEIWTYPLSTEMTEVFFVDNPLNQKTYSVAYPDGQTGVERAIGADGKEVHGTQVLRPSSSVRVTKIWSSMPAQAYFETLDNLKGSVNSAAWPTVAALRRWQPKEVLFRGATWQKNNDGYVQIDYEFLTAPKQDAETVSLADGTTVEVERDPWDYVWNSFVSQPGDSRIRKGIQEVHVAKTYQAKSFTPLGLVGTL